MNGQISDANGYFLYPDGKRYKLGTAPKQWSINDRETQAIVFLSDPEIAKELEEQEKLFKALEQSREQVANLTKVLLMKL